MIASIRLRARVRTAIEYEYRFTEYRFAEYEYDEKIVQPAANGEESFHFKMHPIAGLGAAVGSLFSPTRSTMYLRLSNSQQEPRSFRSLDPQCHSSNGTAPLQVA
jgi:hypothetical protein